MEISKDQLLDDLHDIITIMNQEDYMRRARLRGISALAKKLGDNALRKILRTYKVTTLYELDKKQLSDAIDTIYVDIIRSTKQN